MTFRVTFRGQIDLLSDFFVSLDSLTPKSHKMVSYVILVILIFLDIITTYLIFFDPLGQKRPRVQMAKIGSGLGTQ